MKHLGTWFVALLTPGVLLLGCGFGAAGSASPMHKKPGPNCAPMRG